PRGGPRLAPLLAGPPAGVVSSLRLSRRLRRLRPDIVHTSSLKAALYGGLAARLAGVPGVWHARDRIADDYLPRSAVRVVRAAARTFASAVVADTEATLVTLPGIHHGYVVPSPIPPHDREPHDSGPLRI